MSKKSGRKRRSVRQKRRKVKHKKLLGGTPAKTMLPQIRREYPDRKHHMWIEAYEFELPYEISFQKRPTGTEDAFEDAFRAYSRVTQEGGAPQPSDQLTFTLYNKLYEAEKSNFETRESDMPADIMKQFRKMVNPTKSSQATATVFDSIVQGLVPKVQ